MDTRRLALLLADLGWARCERAAETFSLDDVDGLSAECGACEGDGRTALIQMGAPLVSDGGSQ